MKLHALILATLVLGSSGAWADPSAEDDLTIMAAAPKGLNESHLGRPYSSAFEPLIGKEGKSLFPKSKKPRTDKVNEFTSDFVEIDNSHEYRANAGGWGLAAGLSTGESKRYAAYRAYQLTKVVELDDTTELRPVAANAAYYVRRIFYGRMVEIVVNGDSSAFTADAKAELLVFSGNVSAFAKKHHLEYKVVGRGLKAAEPTDALFARTQDEIKQAYTEDDDFNGGNVVPILVEYRRIPGASLEDFQQYDWTKEDSSTTTSRLRLRTAQINARDSDWQSCGFVLNKGDRVAVVASGTIYISNGKTERHPDSQEQPMEGGDWRRPAAGVLELKLGTLVELTGAKTVVEATEDGKELKFRVRDSNYKDNSGAYTVQVLLIPNDAIPDEAETQ